MPLYNDQLRLGKTYSPDSGVAERTESALAALWALLEAPGLTLAHRRELLGIAIWKYTEAPGVRPHPKYRLPFRTLAAMEVENRAEVQHEHVWPRKWLIDRILPRHAEGWGRQDLEGFMKTHGVACTVTRAEHLLLNACADAEGWERYAQAGIQVWDAVNERPLPLPPLRRTASQEDIDQMRSLAGAPRGVVSEVILAALQGNATERTPLIQQFLEQAEAYDIDLVPKYNSEGKTQTYIRLYDAMLPEATPVAAYVNYNGNLDFHVPPGDLPDLPLLDRAEPWKNRYVRIRLIDAEALAQAVLLLEETLDRLRSIQ